MLENNEDFINYVSLHSRTPRHLFSKQHAIRLMELAGVEIPDGYALYTPAFIQIDKETADYHIKMIRKGENK